MALCGSSTIFDVSDLAAAVKYYCEVLGFEKDFQFEKYAGVKSGRVSIHLNGYDHAKPVGVGKIYIYCEDVDAYYAEIKAKGAILKNEPRDYPYGMRDFQALDPDGNLVNFGMESKTPAEGS
jgi:uncharacterized glyoxalase superfamily protein PhnB